MPRESSRRGSRGSRRAIPGSRGLIANGLVGAAPGLGATTPYSNQNELVGDPMAPPQPKYTYQEERPETRGNQSHGGMTAGGSRGGRRQRKLPIKLQGGGGMQAFDVP